jgi:UDP-glucose 4-epimerase
MNILITGGTGYLGSHLILTLSKNNIIFILDKTKNKLKKKNKKYSIYYSGYVNSHNIKKIFNKHNIDLVIHFAGVLKQKKNHKQSYYKDIESTRQLVKALKEFRIKYFIYSSSCDVYGNTKKSKVKENHKCHPISNYGKNKLLSERYIEKYLKNSQTKYFILRIFNIIGCNLDIPKKNDIISNLINSYKQKKYFNLYGYRCNTRDGTCVRDYLSIEKFVQIIANLITKLHIIKSNIFNVGSSFGISNLSIIKQIENKFKIKITYKKLRKRKQDPVLLVANNNKIKNNLNLNNEYFNNENILRSYKSYFK